MNHNIIKQFHQGSFMPVHTMMRNNFISIIMYGVCHDRQKPTWGIHWVTYLCNFLTTGSLIKCPGYLYFCVSVQLTIAIHLTCFLCGLAQSEGFLRC
jgi:hypothetical protein